MLVKYGTAAVVIILALMAYFPDLMRCRPPPLRWRRGVKNLHRIPVAKPVSISGENNASLLARS